MIEMLIVLLSPVEAQQCDPATDSGIYAKLAFIWGLLSLIWTNLKILHIPLNQTIQIKNFSPVISQIEAQDP